MDPWHYLLTGSILKESKARCYLRSSTTGCIPAHLPSDWREPPLPTAQALGSRGGILRDASKGVLGLQQPYMPLDLQRALLKEERASAGGATAAALSPALRGNCLAAWPTPTGALLCYPVGTNSEALALTAIRLLAEEEGEGGQEGAGAAGPLQLPQVGPTRAAVVASTPLQQLAPSALSVSPLEGQRHLLAVRTAYSLSVLFPQQAEGDKGAGAGSEAGEWELRGGRSWSTHRPLADLCWSQVAPGQGAALTEDLTLLGFNVNAQGAVGLEQLWGGSSFLEALPSGPQPAAAAAGSLGALDRPCCEWGHHPRTVLVSTGRQLLSVDVRAAGGGAALPLWACGPGEGLLALSAGGQGPEGHPPFLSALTSRQVLLFDLRRPHLPAARWDLPPTLRSLRRKGAAAPGRPHGHERGTLEEAAASSAEYMQRAPHALQLLRLPAHWESGGTAQQQGQRQALPGRSAAGALDSRRSKAAAATAGTAGGGTEGAGGAAVEAPLARLGCVLHTDLDLGASTAYCFHSGQGHRFRARAPAQGSRAGRLELEPLAAPAGLKAESEAAAPSPEPSAAQQGSPLDFFPLTQASQAPHAWDRLEQEGGGGSAPPALGSLEWEPAFMVGRVVEAAPQRVADPLRHRPVAAAMLATARLHAVQHAQQAAQVAVAARPAAAAARDRAPGGGDGPGAQAGRQQAGDGARGAALAPAGSLGEEVAELQGASAIWAPSSSGSDADQSMVLFRLTGPGDILISRITPAEAGPNDSLAQHPAAASAQPSGLAAGSSHTPGPSGPPGPPQACADGMGPSCVDPPGSVPPLLWPPAAKQPGELLLGAAAAQARLAQDEERRKPPWLQKDGKYVVELSLHRKLMELCLGERHGQPSAPAAPSSLHRVGGEVRAQQLQHVQQQQGDGEEEAVRRILGQLDDLAAPATLWELHSRATLAALPAADPGILAPSDAPSDTLDPSETPEGEPQVKRQRRARPAKHAQQQHAVVPKLPAGKFDLSQYSFADRFPDPVPPLQRLTLAYGLVGPRGSTQQQQAQQPEQQQQQWQDQEEQQEQRQQTQQPGGGPESSRAAQARRQHQEQQRQEQPHRQGGRTERPGPAWLPQLFPSPQCLAAALALPRPGSQPWGAAAAEQAAAGDGAGGTLCWQACLHTPVLRAAEQGDVDRREAGRELAGGPQGRLLSSSGGCGVVLVAKQHLPEEGPWQIASQGVAGRGGASEGVREAIRALREQWRAEWPGIEEESRRGSAGNGGN